MERVNNSYVKINKFDLLCNFDNDKSGVIRSLLNYIFAYEKDNKGAYVGDFYMNVNGPYCSRLFSVYEFQISRNSLINSFLYAGYDKDLNMLFQLHSFVSLDFVSIDRLGNLSSYVLEHSIDFNEFLDGEKEKLVFDDKSCTFVEKYIYDKSSIKSLKKN